MEERPTGQEPLPGGPEALCDVRERFRQLFEDARLAYQSLDAEGRILLVNRAWLDLLGYVRGEVVGRSFSDFLAPGGSELFRQRFPLLKERGEIHDVEFDMVRKDGKTHTVSFESRISRNPDGSFRQTHCILTDVTERRKAEAERALLASMVDASPVSITVHDFNGKFLYANERTLQMHGYTREEFLALGLHDLDTPRSAALIAERMIDVNKKGEALFEVRHRRKDGTDFPLLVHARLVPWEGRQLILSLATDISEKKRTEDALALRDAQLGGLVSNAGSGVAITDVEGRFTFVNKALCDVIGHAEGELIGRNFADFLHPDDLGGILKAFAAGHETPGKVVHIEFRVIRKDGSVRHCYSTPTAQLVNGELAGFTAIVFDITSRKEAEEALRASEERFRKLFDEGPLGMALSDMQYRFLGSNRMFHEILGYTPDELSRLTFRDFTHRDCIAQDLEGLKRLDAGEMPVYRTEKRYIRKDKSEVWGRLTVSLLHDASGRPVHHLVMLEDITARRRLEDAIRESEERYRSLVENSLEGVLLTAPDGRILSANPAACRMLGRAEEEICRLGRDGVVDKGDPRLKAALGERARTGKYTSELTLVRRDGTKFPANVSSAIFDMPDGGKRTVITISDLTERKRAEDTLRQSEEKWRSLVTTLPDYIAILDREGRYLFLNRYANGYSEKDVLGASALGYISEKDRRPYEERFKACIETGEDQFLEYDARGDQGSIRKYESYFVPIKLEGAVVQVMNIARDITERREAEDSLRRSELRYRSLFENMQEGYALCRMAFDGKGRPLDFTFIDVNRAFSRLSGLEDVRGRMASEVVSGFDKRAPGLLELVSRVASGGRPEVRDLDVSGLGLKASWLSLSLFSPAPGDFVAVFSDITERKKAELALRRALMRYELEEGGLYIAMESWPNIAFEAFRDLLKAGYEGFALTRPSGPDLARWQLERCKVMFLSSRGGPGALPPDADTIGGWAEGLPAGRAIFIDRLDYLASRSGFHQALHLVHRLADLARERSHIVLLSVDPSALGAREARLLEKEGRPVEPLLRSSVPGELLETMKYVFERNISGVRPTLVSVGRDLGLSKPTVRKRIRAMLSAGYLVSRSRGAGKTLELTEKGRSVLLR